MEDVLQQKVEQFFRKFETKTYKKGDIIIQAHDAFPSIFYLKKGYVRHCFISKDGEDITMHTFRSGSFFPIVLVLSGVANKYTFEASTTVEAIKAPSAEVLDYIKSQPDILFDLTKRLAKGINGYLLRTENLMLEEAYIKVVSLILYFAIHFGKESGSGVTIDLPLTHKEIATWIGVSRETVSRQFEKLKKNKLLQSFEKQIIVLDFHKLEKEVKSRNENSR